MPSTPLRATDLGLCHIILGIAEVIGCEPLASKNSLSTTPGQSVVTATPVGQLRV